jgi:hypothetical protein
LKPDGLMADGHLTLSPTMEIFRMLPAHL